MDFNDINARAADYQKQYNAALLEDVMPFWMESDLIDKINGGYITSVDRMGKAYNEDKSVWFQGRCLWTFSTLCRRYGGKMQDSWKAAADNGKAFLEEFCTDKDKRMFFQVTREGLPLRKRRYMFSESFYVLGMAEYGAAFGDSDSLSKAEQCFELMLNLYRDPLCDPYKITPKSYTATRRERAAANPMVMLCCAQTLRRCCPARHEHYSAVVDEIVRDMLQYHVHPEMKCVLETVSDNGGFIDNPSGRTVNPGHACENSWFLMNQAIATDDKELFGKACEILDWSLEIGWDKEYGGLFYYCDAKGRPCEQLEWDMKLWWVHNEALIATLFAYSVTRDLKYWNWFEKINAYAFSHFSDKTHGEWYGYLHRDGTVSHTQKGSMWKGPFHLPRCLMICDYLLQTIAQNETPQSVL